MFSSNGLDKVVLANREEDSTILKRFLISIGVSLEIGPLSRILVKAMILTIQLAGVFANGEEDSTILNRLLISIGVSLELEPLILLRSHIMNNTWSKGFDYE